jgi:hypothetical protein
LETYEEDTEQRILQRRSQPIDQLDRVIEEIRRMMLKSTKETLNSREKLKSGEPIAIG